VIRVLLADDQALVRGGFRSILDGQDDIEVVGEAADGAEAVEQAIRAAPDVILMDIRMPRLDGIEATRRLLGGDRVRSRVLMLTTFDDDEYVYEAFRAGASGFLLKSAPPRELAGAVRTIAADAALLAPEITRRMIEDYVRRPRPGPGQRASLGALTGPCQRRDRGRAVPERADDQNLRDPDPGQAATPGPRPGRRLRLRERPRPARWPVTGGWGGWDSNPGPADYESAALTG
jgi:DNA-binding NarL/FixJ family response regulator